MLLKERAADAGVEHHRKLEVRVYEGDWAQRPRIAKARALVGRAVAEVGREVHILELCCGTADISGPFAATCSVRGFDCNRAALEEAMRRFPRGAWQLAAVESLTPETCDVLILCETLEHLADPVGLVKASLPLAKHSVISHPLDEPMGSGLSNGDHQWSFTLDDFKGWFALGGHELVEYELFEMGAYKAVIGRGRRIAAD